VHLMCVLCCHLLFVLLSRFVLVILMRRTLFPIGYFEFGKSTSPCDTLRNINDVHNQQNSTDIPDDVQVNENHTSNECVIAFCKTLSPLTRRNHDIKSCNNS